MSELTPTPPPGRLDRVFEAIPHPVEFVARELISASVLRRIGGSQTFRQSFKDAGLGLVRIVGNSANIVSDIFPAGESISAFFDGVKWARYAPLKVVRDIAEILDLTPHFKGGFALVTTSLAEVADIATFGVLPSAAVLGIPQILYDAISTPGRIKKLITTTKGILDDEWREFQLNRGPIASALRAFNVRLDIDKRIKPAKFIKPMEPDEAFKKLVYTSLVLTKESKSKLLQANWEGPDHKREISDIERYSIGKFLALAKRRSLGQNRALSANISTYLQEAEARPPNLPK